jgi:mRNA-degrading endonuclease YafQ of YafQ-DinJ toxin-antitoxin module
MQRKVFERTQVLAIDPFHPLLKDHKLNPPYEGCRSINITGDYRLIYKKLAPDTYFLRAVGTHHQLFGT